jgi:Tol biopolymer transport system component
VACFSRRSTGGRKPGRSWIGLLLAGGVAGFGPQPGDAQPVRFTQITDTSSAANVASNVLPSIDAAGTRISFLSSSDLTPGKPGNPNGNRHLYIFDTTTGLFTQLTSINGNTSGPVLEQSINAAGTRIAFISNADMTPGNPGNADGNYEIFFVDIATGVVTQVTHTTGGGVIGGVTNSGPLINAAGTRIVFSSDRDLTPGNPGNADGNREVFLFDTTTGLFTQITDTTGGINGVVGNAADSMNAAGTRIVLSSNRDLTPGSPGNADGNVELFLYDTTTGLFTQLTNTAHPANNQNASINAAGTRIAFVSDADLAPGSPGNADGNPEIFLFDTSTGLFTQITNTIGPGVTTHPTINAAGTRIAFTSTRDLTPGQPGNTDGNSEVFLFDITTGLFAQITNSAGSGGGVPNQGPEINADGTRITFFSNRDLVPGNPGNADGNFEIFLAIGIEATARSIPTLSGSIQLALTALLLASGLVALRRGTAQSGQDQSSSPVSSRKSARSDRTRGRRP